MDWVVFQNQRFYKKGGIGIHKIQNSNNANTVILTKKKIGECIKKLATKGVLSSVMRKTHS